MARGGAFGRIVDTLYHVQSGDYPFGDLPYATLKIGFDKRDVEKEEWVI